MEFNDQERGCQPERSDGSALREPKGRTDTSLLW
jgi:hypothetical protein